MHFFKRITSQNTSKVNFYFYSQLCLSCVNVTKFKKVTNKHSAKKQHKTKNLNNVKQLLKLTAIEKKDIKNI